MVVLAFLAPQVSWGAAHLAAEMLQYYYNTVSIQEFEVLATPNVNQQVVPGLPTSLCQQNVKTCQNMGCFRSSPTLSYGKMQGLEIVCASSCIQLHKKAQGAAFSWHRCIERLKETHWTAGERTKATWLFQESTLLLLVAEYEETTYNYCTVPVSLSGQQICQMGVLGRGGCSIVLQQATWTIRAPISCHQRYCRRQISLSVRLRLLIAMSPLPSQQSRW